ncbi:hypothetical protein C1H46_035112 [Malus baccata]|uniref:F-box domain-containing protein n=1 Tax=Malus baccata TaxID=106549 RepID=A0A540KYP4_MALBA|nr:hypothetical protein C1H46_035112 [Malus baccata]
MVDWAGLPRELIFSLAERMRSLEEFIVFGAVCKSWRSVATKENYFTKELGPKHQVPLLILPQEKGAATRKCYNLKKHPKQAEVRIVAPEFPKEYLGTMMQIKVAYLVESAGDLLVVLCFLNLKTKFHATTPAELSRSYLVTAIHGWTRSTPNVQQCNHPHSHPMATSSTTMPGNRIGGRLSQENVVVSNCVGNPSTSFLVKLFSITPKECVSQEMKFMKSFEPIAQSRVVIKELDGDEDDECNLKEERPMQVNRGKAKLAIEYPVSDLGGECSVPSQCVTEVVEEVLDDMGDVVVGE